MSKTNKTVKEPFIHVTKRSDISIRANVAIRVGAVLIAILFCTLLSYLMVGVTPGRMISSLFSGSFGSKRRIWKFFKDMAVLLCISLAVTPAFRMKFWNIGAEGQTLMGCLSSVACIIWFGGKLPEPVLVLVMLAASLTVSAIWGLLPAIFKALWGTNETLFTLMMNYIATGLVSYALMVWTPSGSSTLGMLDYGYMPVLFHDYFLIIAISLLLTGALFIYLNYTKHGYEISVVGESPKTAMYIGINVKKVIIRTMALSGALCGLAGFLLVSALNHSVTTASVGGQGFTAIMVSWLGKFNPVMMLVTSSLITFLNQGASQISTDFNIDKSFPNIIVGIIIFFIIGCEFFVNYKINFRKPDKKD